MGKYNQSVDFFGYEKGRKHLVVSKNKMFGTYNGYVGIPKRHRLYGVDYDNLEEDIEVHGGVTYSGYGYELVEGMGEGFREDYWYYGFDTMHYGDDIPGIDMEALTNILKKILPKEMHSVMDEVGEVEYRDMAYVKKEVDSLAKQLG